MKKLLLALALFSNLFAAPLIYISNDMSSLNDLNERYKQKLLINDERIYLIPKQCQLERYFGGVSEGQMKLIQGPIQTNEILITQEVFEAKETKDIQDSLQVQKTIALVEGTAPKEFLDDNEGRGFGGASQTTLDYTFQKMQAKKENFIPVKEPNRTAEDTLFPSCELLEDGSGYKISNIKEAKFYEKGHFYPLTKTTQFFN